LIKVDLNVKNGKSEQETEQVNFMDKKKKQTIPFQKAALRQ